MLHRLTQQVHIHIGDIGVITIIHIIPTLDREGDITTDALAADILRLGDIETTIPITLTTCRTHSINMITKQVQYRLTPYQGWEVQIT